MVEGRPSGGFPEGVGPQLIVSVRRRPTLPHPPECSTIGAGGLSFRVRNETGRFPSAITTETAISDTTNTPATPQTAGVGVVVCCESHSGRGRTSSLV